MHISTLLAILPVALAAPTSDGELAALNLRESFTGTYIVKLKDTITASGADAASALLQSEPEHVFSEVLNGFSAQLDEDTVEALRRHPDVSDVQVSNKASLFF